MKKFDIDKIPLNSIITTHKDKFTVRFKTDCSCEHPEHVIDAWIELADKGSFVNMIFYKNIAWDDYWDCEGRFFERMGKRIKAACKILFRGRIELSEEFIFRGEDHVKEFVGAITNVLNSIKEEKENDKEQKRTIN